MINHSAQRQLALEDYYPIKNNKVWLKTILYWVFTLLVCFLAQRLTIAICLITLGFCFTFSTFCICKKKPNSICFSLVFDFIFFYQIAQFFLVLSVVVVQTKKRVLLFFLFWLLYFLISILFAVFTLWYSKRAKKSKTQDLSSKNMGFVAMLSGIFGGITVKIIVNYLPKDKAEQLFGLFFLIGALMVSMASGTTIARLYALIKRNKQ